MPGYDRSGPEGQGSRTGRQLGKCNSKKETTQDPGFEMGRGMGRGVGLAASRAARCERGKGMRRGWQHRPGNC